MGCGNDLICDSRRQLRTVLIIQGIQECNCGHFLQHVDKLGEVLVKMRNIANPYGIAKLANLLLNSSNRDFWDIMMGKHKLEKKPRQRCIRVVGRRNDCDTILTNLVFELPLHLRIHELHSRTAALVQLCSTHCHSTLAYPVLHLVKKQIDSRQLQIPSKYWRLMQFKVGM